MGRDQSLRGVKQTTKGIVIPKEAVAELKEKGVDLLKIIKFQTGVPQKSGQYGPGPKGWWGG